MTSPATVTRLVDTWSGTRVGDVWPVVGLADSWPVTVARKWSWLAFGSLVVQPLATLYLDGPTFFGMWGGASPETICAQLTEVSAEHWSRSEENMADCNDTIQRHFNSWLVLGSAVVYFGVIGVSAYKVFFCRRAEQEPTHQIVLMHPPCCPDKEKEKKKVKRG